MPTPFLKGQKRHRLQTWEISIQEAKFSLKFKARPEVPKAGRAGRVHRPPTHPGGTRMACIQRSRPVVVAEEIMLLCVLAHPSPTIDPGVSGTTKHHF